MKVSELWRYPVKSLQGEQLDSLVLGSLGATGDRRWAVVSSSTGRALSAKTVPELLMGSARLDGDELVLDHPGGDLMGWLGRDDVVLQEVSSDTSVSYEMTFDPPHDEAELFEIPAPPATFMDLAAVHVLTTASLARMAEARPDLGWDRRRFRPTILVDSDDAGFPEQHWVGKRLRIGSAELSVDLETVRCAMPLRAQPANGTSPVIERSVDVYRALDETHYNHLGVYCSVVEPGLVTQGDTVEVVAP